MKTKSLLLGSAAAMMAVTTANAADVFIPEPEVVEYVRVCDAAGVGYFFIPGSEVCLKIGGYLRYEIGFGENNAATAADGDQTWDKRARASFQVSSWADTELGPLTTFVETRWQWDTVGGRNQRYINGPNWTLGPNGYETEGQFSINFAWIELAGLRIGKDESYFTTFTGYGGPTIGGGVYGPFDTNLISYTFSNGGFTAGIALEQGDDNYWTDVTFGGVYDRHVGWGIDDYVPHIVAGAGYRADNFQIRGVFGYDTRNNMTNPQFGFPERMGGWTGKLRADATFDPVSVFAMLMYGENSSAYTAWRNGRVDANGEPIGETFSVLAGGSVTLTEDLTFNTTVQWIDGAPGQTDRWIAEANVSYDITDGLYIRPEVNWTQGHNGQDSWGGIVRIQRSLP